jgi:hypothetical protein
MMKLYKRLPGGHLAYHEAWVTEGTVVEHWGMTGSEGEQREHPTKSRQDAREIERVLASARREGFAEIEDNDHRRLIVEYQVSGMGTPKDLEKRQRLEAHLNETLGWTGLGHCDGGSIGSGSMEVCCFVVDFLVAKPIVEQSLAETEFADYSRIYDEDADADA